MFSGIIWGKNKVLYLEIEPNYHINNQNAKNRRSNMAQNMEVGLTSHAEKMLRQRNKWHQQFDRGTLMASPKFQTRILHFKPFGQDF